MNVPYTEINRDALRRSPQLAQMGAVIHSTPLVITQKGVVKLVNNIPVSSEREEYVVFGTTQGLLHVVDATTGVEKFAFLPREMLEPKAIKDANGSLIRTDTKQRDAMLDKDKTLGTGLAYGIDAPWTAYTEYVPTSDGYLTVGSGKEQLKGKQWLYGGLRMGGRSYYSLDLTDLSKPKLKFVIDPDSATSGPLSFMGQSWSKPTIAKVKWKGKDKLVMFVGGGYDPNFESAEYNTTNPTQGSGVYMFDADNGDLLWWAGANVTNNSNSGSGTNALQVSDMRYSVPSSISILDRDGDSFVDNLYFGDLGGQLWRIDINNKATTTSAFAIRAAKLANFNKANGLSPRFYEAPSVAAHKPSGVPRFVSVSIGSGNRSLPLKIYTGNGYEDEGIYVIYDYDIINKKLTDDPAMIKDSSYISFAASPTKELTGSNALLDLTLYSSNTNNDFLKNLINAYAKGGWYVLLRDPSNVYKQRLKVLGKTVAINNNLYVPVFDDIPSNSSSSTTICGGGVRGSSSIRRYRIVYDPLCTVITKANEAQCKFDTNQMYVGAGIYGVNIGRGTTAYDRQVIGGVCTGNSCIGGGGANDGGNIGGNTTSVKVENVVDRRIFPSSWYEKMVGQ